MDNEIGPKECLKFDKANEEKLKKLTAGAFIQKSGKMARQGDIDGSVVVVVRY